MLPQLGARWETWMTLKNGAKLLDISHTGRHNGGRLDFI